MSSEARRRSLDLQAEQAAERLRNANSALDALQISQSAFGLACPSENAPKAAFELMVSIVRDHRDRLMRELEFCNELAERNAQNAKPGT